MTSSTFLSRNALLLGYSGLLPQIICVALVLGDSEYRWVALACAWAYAALIFSFLGGVWWGIAVANPALDRRIYVIAVLPSLIALASYIPWTLGHKWPGPSLVALGLCLAASPLVDQWIARQTSLPAGWLHLRWHLSLGLGALSLLLALLA
jgi:hypothetical protein